MSLQSHDCWNCGDGDAHYPEHWCSVCIWRHDFARMWWRIGWHLAGEINPPCSQSPGFCVMSDHHSQPWVGSTSYCRNWQPSWRITKADQLPNNMVVR